MKNSLRIHKWTHNEFNIFILGVLTHPPCGKKRDSLSLQQKISNNHKKDLDYETYTNCNRSGNRDDHDS